jgi:hypothetical protein
LFHSLFQETRNKEMSQVIQINVSQIGKSTKPARKATKPAKKVTKPAKKPTKPTKSTKKETKPKSLSPTQLKRKAAGYKLAAFNAERRQLQAVMSGVKL